MVTRLKEHEVQKVLDVALGDGVDTIYLLQQDFDVSANEFDPSFRQKAVENAWKVGFEIAPSNLDWRELAKSYPFGSQDAVICLGNSLACLFGRENQLAALKQFYQVLKPGGVLLIDERNFQRILDNRKSALVGTLHSTGRYLYTGTTKVQARFAEITNETIYIEYTHLETGKKAYYKVFPFKRGELMQLLQEAGFSQIEKFSDYQEGDNPDADFYQYVCVK